MKMQYVISEDEIKKAKGRLIQLRAVALMSRDAGDKEASREFYLKAKGFEDALVMLGIVKED